MHGSKKLRGLHMIAARLYIYQGRHKLFSGFNLTLTLKITLAVTSIPSVLHQHSCHILVPQQ